MNNGDDIRDGSSGGDDILAAEYVLGTLSAEEHAAFVARLVQDPVLRGHVAFWQHRLAQLDESFEEVAPPPQILPAIERRLFGSTAAAGPLAALWNSLALWRATAVAGLAVAVVAVGYTLTQPAQLSPEVFATQLVAALEAEGSDVRFMALYNKATGEVRLTGLSGEVPSDKDLELWLIEGDRAPISMGLVQASTHNEVPVTRDLQVLFNEGSVLAITLEPKGGSPTGKATGPIVAAGEAVEI